MNSTVRMYVLYICSCSKSFSNGSNSGFPHHLDIPSNQKRITVYSTYRQYSLLSRATYSR